MADISGAREMALNVLLQVETKGAYANLALDGAFQDWPAPKSERGFCTELVYGTVRHRLTLDWILGAYLSRPLEALKPAIRNILRLSLYQLAIMGHKPEAAVVNEAVVLARKHGHKGVAGLVNAVLRGYLREPDKAVFPPLDLDPAGHISLRFSHPNWLVKRWISHFGIQETMSLCARNNLPAPVTIRANTMRCTRRQLIERLADEGVTAAETPMAPEGLQISGFDRLESLPSYRDGCFTVQDESSMLVGHVLSPNPGDVVVDLCGAPGGKTTHLAQLMQDKGSIISVDLHRHRTKLIQQTASRLGINIVATVAGDALGFHMPEDTPVDAVLLDAPCTGTGVLGRRPDARWRRTPEELGQLTGIQRKLLEKATALIRPGGILVYSTCSLEPEEGHEAVRWALDRFPEMHSVPLRGRLPDTVLDKGGADGEEGWIYLLPWIHDTDGFFIACLQKGKTNHNESFPA